MCHYPSFSTKNICHACYTDLPILKCQNALPPFTVTYALFAYQGEVARLIMNLKFQAKLINANLLGTLLADYLEDQYKNKKLPDVMIPMPLHPKRQRKRGFNQALEIARPISRLLRIPIDMTSVVRTKYTTAQATLSATARKRNMREAFWVGKKFTNQHIAILDDVVTTGETTRALAHALAAAGVSQIDVWCVARAQKQK